MPIAGIILVFLASVFLPDVMNVNFSKHCSLNTFTGEETCYYYGYSQNWLLGISIPSVIVSLVLPFAIYSYRHSISKADMFEQIPFKKNYLRNFRLGLGFAVIFVTMTIVFWLGIWILYTIQSNAAAAKGAPMFFFGYFGIVYLFLLAIIFVAYFESCLFASFGSGAIDCGLFFIFGNIILSLVVIGPALYFSSLNSSMLEPPSFFSFSFVNPMVMMSRVTDRLIVYGEYGNLGNLTGYAYGGLGTTLALASASAAYCFLAPEPSGEMANRAMNRSWWKTSIIIAGLLLTAISLMGAGLNNAMGATGVIIVFLWVLACYLSFAIYDASFKLTINHWIAFGISSAVVFTLYITHVS